MAATVDESSQYIASIATPELANRNTENVAKAIPRRKTSKVVSEYQRSVWNVGRSRLLRWRDKTVRTTQGPYRERKLPPIWETVRKRMHMVW